MNQALQPQLREFTRTVLERRGALVEWLDSSDEGLALLTSDAAAALGVPETLRLAYQPGSAGLCINLATDFLERLRPLLEIEPQIGFFRIPELYLKKASMDEPVARAFTWQNARVKVEGAEPRRIEYHTWYFLAALDSDDRWEELVSTTINATSGAEVGPLNPLGLDGLVSGESSENGTLPTPPPPLDTYHQAVRRAGVCLEHHAAPFIARLESRLERDRQRLREYYHALLQETKTPRHRPVETDPQQQAAKRRAVELELRRKLAELEERYALRATLTPQTLIRLEMPVLAVQCTVWRKQARRTHTVFWNPLLKALEPMCCAGCGESIFSVFFTDNDVKPLCNVCIK